MCIAPGITAICLARSPSRLTHGMKSARATATPAPPASMPAASATAVKTAARLVVIIACSPFHCLRGR